MYQPTVRNIYKCHLRVLLLNRKSTNDVDQLVFKRAWSQALNAKALCFDK